VPERTAPQSLSSPDLRPYQDLALAAWETAHRRGVIVLPTGAGKTRVAVAAIARTGARTLCLVPTRVLLDQWCEVLAASGAKRVGRYGDGERTVGDVTVATFKSAFLYAEDVGNLFDLLVVDEAHHFGGGVGDESLEMCTALWRLGLTATPVSDDTRCARLDRLLGPVVYGCSVEELAGTFLAPFKIVTLSLPLGEREQRRYDAECDQWRPLARQFFRTAAGASWTDFVRAAGRTDEGRRALAAWRRSRALVRWPEPKRAAVRELLRRHAAARTLVFAPDAVTAYAVSRETLIPAITAR
jgi:superfamily II DNA or RNA helicase